jgi:GntR family transcriptional regulator
MVRRKDGRPLWQQVLDDLERRLDNGEFDPRFPTDRELVDHYGTSRHTVREAVRHLKARGVIERERGRGSVVTSTMSQPLGALYNLFAAVESAGRTQDSRVLALDMKTDAHASSRFGYDPSTPLVHLERLRLMDDEPLALDTVWLAPDIGRPLLQIDFKRTSLYDELEAHTGIRPGSGTETISAVVPDDSMIEVLELDPGEGLLRLERVTRHADRVIECRLTLLRSSRMALTTTWPGESNMVPRVIARDDEVTL